MRSGGLVSGRPYVSFQEFDAFRGRIQDGPDRIHHSFSDSVSGKKEYLIHLDTSFLVGVDEAIFNGKGRNAAIQESNG
jgi:hypothetical protein